MFRHGFINIEILVKMKFDVKTVLDNESSDTGTVGKLRNKTFLYYGRLAYKLLIPKNVLKHAGRC